MVKCERCQDIISVPDPERRHPAAAEMIAFGVRIQGRISVAAVPEGEPAGLIGRADTLDYEASLCWRCLLLSLGWGANGMTVPNLEDALRIIMDIYRRG